ncbi:hypothetical protein K1719_044473 [Acacia pycnantha]|nr:hypothetical protein K1719_044473 [Acacia pycnantha]
MKGMDLFCSSPASTAVISSMQAQPSTARRSRKNYGLLAPVPCSCSSLSPINPSPSSYQKHKKSSEDDKQNHALIRRKSYVRLNDLYTDCNTASSTTHLLADSDSSSIHSDRSPALRPPPPPHSPRSRNQVVILKVSLHCKGCAAKVGKHISKMQGVTSFCIDMMSKKVTIMGDVTPQGVLASVSKIYSSKRLPGSVCLYNYKFDDSSGFMSVLKCSPAFRAMVTAHETEEKTEKLLFCVSTRSPQLRKTMTEE